MTAEVIGLLAGRGTVVDMTVGSGGHAAALLEAGVSRLVGVDRDPEALALARERLSAFGDRVRLVGARFSEVDEDVVVLGVRDRMEIWDRTSYERYEAAHAGAYQVGALEPGKSTG